ncbi:MAG: hypothetical protein IJR00_03410 [Lachnospiraceae bacterium]|nr:hypothetical protein [Lachnospiraceae bacterium]
MRQNGRRTGGTGVIEKGEYPLYLFVKKREEQGERYIAAEEDNIHAEEELSRVS